MIVSVKPSVNPTDAAFIERLGTVVRGKWKLEALLGVGGMAAVYAASQPEGERVALKILHASFAHDKTACERFLREALVTNKVQHPATVRIFENDTTEEGEPFLVMELLEGETVRDAWRRVGRTMPIIPALQIAERVIDCLAACHEAGVIHRDLKPANLFITDASQIKVLDFGVAQMREDAPAAGEKADARWAMGTPAYMSPEQAMGRDLDGRADLFSVGAMLHALITGHRLNAAKTEAESLVLAASKPVASVKTLAPNLPPEVARLIDRALAWDRQSRFRDAEQMQEAALEALASQGGEPLGEKGGEPRPIAFDLSGAPTREPLSMSFGERHPPSGRSVPVRAFFLHVDGALGSARVHGFEHEQTSQALRKAIEALAAMGFSTGSGAEPPPTRALFVDVLPYGFVAEGVLVWEPSSSAIPYRLFESGVRNLAFENGLLLEELREFLSIASKEPGKDLPPDDDLRSALWERALPHVVVTAPPKLAIGTAFERDQFLREVQTRQASITEAVIECADAVDAGDRRLQPEGVLDDDDKAAAERELMLGTEEWTLRYIDAVVFGYAAATNEAEAERVLSSLRKSSAYLLASARLATTLGVYHAMVARLTERVDEARADTMTTALARAFFGDENLRAVVLLASKQASVQALLEPPLARLGFESLEAAARTVRTSQPPSLRPQPLEPLTP